MGWWVLGALRAGGLVGAAHQSPLAFAPTGRTTPGPIWSICAGSNHPAVRNTECLEVCLRFMVLGPHRIDTPAASLPAGRPVYRHDGNMGGTNGAEISRLLVRLGTAPTSWLGSVRRLGAGGTVQSPLGPAVALLCAGPSLRHDIIHRSRLSSPWSGAAHWSTCSKKCVVPSSPLALAI